MPVLPRPRRPGAPLALLALLVLAALAARAVILGAVAARLRSTASARGLEASWSDLRLGFPLRFTCERLTLTRARTDTVMRVDSLRVAMDPWSLVRFHPAPGAVEILHARFLRGGAGGADPDTLDPESAAAPRGAGAERAARLRHGARSLIGALLAPARRLPRVALRDVTLASRDDDGPRVSLAWLDLAPGAAGVKLAGAGTLTLEREVPFAFDMRYGDDDRLAGGARFGVPDSGRGAPVPLLLTVDGHVNQDRAAGVLRIADSTRFTVGRVPFTLGGTLERGGPRVTLALAADGLTAERWKRSLPPAVLGPLEDVAVRGSFDYRVTLDLDLARPDSVTFAADVIPHGLALDLDRTRLNLGALEGPFVATIHLPRGRLVTRDLSPSNPHFLTLERIDSLLAHAVVTNEDGGFFRHHGFNTEAVKGAIAENVRAGSWRRGAGTITMQLARNLWLGHARTLSRKGQEVVLAWVLENLLRLDKRRLLEIYLNIIEWGPEVHGADEAAQYYFGHGAQHVSVSEALFLTTVVPAPVKWRYRFDAAGDLRPFERAQMHFIGRAMVAKGWLRAEDLPESDALRVELRGPARDVLFPPVGPADPAARGDGSARDRRP